LLFGALPLRQPKTASRAIAGLILLKGTPPAAVTRSPKTLLESPGTAAKAVEVRHLGPQLRHLSLARVPKFDFQADIAAFRLVLTFCHRDFRAKNRCSAPCAFFVRTPLRESGGVVER